MAKIEAFEDSHFMRQTVRVCHTDHTDSIVSSTACIFDFKKNFLCNPKLRTLTLGYSLGMVKIEAFDNSHFMHQTVRGRHTDSIVSSMACIFDFKYNFLCNQKLINVRTLTLAYSLGIVKIEAFDNSNFMHQTVRSGHTDHTDTCSIIPSLPPSLVFCPLIPADFPSITLEVSDKEVKAWYTPMDFALGKTLNIMGRKFLMLVSSMLSCLFSRLLAFFLPFFLSLFLSFFLACFLIFYLWANVPSLKRKGGGGGRGEPPCEC